MTERQKIAKQYSDHFTGVNNTEVARQLYKVRPDLFGSVEAARHYIKTIRNTPDISNSANFHGLSEDEKELILKYRESKTVLEEECNRTGIPLQSVKHYWYKSKAMSIFAKPNQKRIEDLKAEMMEGMQMYSPKFPKIVRQKFKDSYCLVIDPADIHIGKLASDYETGDKYNTNIAVKRVKEGIKSLVSMAAHYPIDQIVLIIGNDILHTDNAKRTTTSGTPQDTDGQWYDNFLIAQKLYVDVIESLLPLAKVHVMHDPSNHDYMTGWFLAQITETWFRNCNDITFDSTLRHRKAYRYYDNLIGTTHGDGAKTKDLNALLAHEFPELWSVTKHRYIYTHHVHHKTSKDLIGVTVESSRSASGTDSWHSRNGYCGAPKAIEAYLHHKTKGQIARFTHIF